MPRLKLKRPREGARKEKQTETPMERRLVGRRGDLLLPTQRLQRRAGWLSEAYKRERTEFREREGVGGKKKKKEESKLQLLVFLLTIHIYLQRPDFNDVIWVDGVVPVQRSTTHGPLWRPDQNHEGRFYHRPLCPLLPLLPKVHHQQEQV